MKASERFTEEAAAELRDAIADAGYNEVFAVGKLDGRGLVSEIVVGARGGQSSVPALAGFLDRGDVLIHNHPSGFLEPSDADLAVASRAGENGVGCYIVDGDVREVYRITSYNVCYTKLLRPPSSSTPASSPASIAIRARARTGSATT